MRFISQDKRGRLFFVATKSEAVDAEGLERSVEAECIVRGINRRTVEVRRENLGSVCRVTLTPIVARG